MKVKLIRSVVRWCEVCLLAASGALWCGVHLGSGGPGLQTDFVCGAFSWSGRTGDPSHTALVVEHTPFPTSEGGMSASSSLHSSLLQAMSAWQSIYPFISSHPCMAGAVDPQVFAAEGCAWPYASQGSSSYITQFSAGSLIL